MEYTISNIWDTLKNEITKGQKVEEINFTGMHFMGTNVNINDLESLASSLRWTYDRELSDIIKGNIQGVHGNYNCVIPLGYFNPLNWKDTLNHAYIVDDYGNRKEYRNFRDT